MSMVGFIKDWRQELESDIWLMPPMYHRVWQWLKYSANHSQGKIPNSDGTFTVINPGQCATSYRLIAQGVGYYEGRTWREPNVKTVKVILCWLVKQGMIHINSNTKGSIITIKNWELYQSKDVEGNSDRITEETPKKRTLDTKKNDKEYINILCANFFEQIWQMYPNKRGKGQVSLTQKKKLYNIGLEEMTRAINRYKKDLANEPWRKPQNGSTFFNSGYVDYLDANYEDKPIQTAKPVQASEIPEGWL